MNFIEESEAESSEGELDFEGFDSDDQQETNDVSGSSISKKKPLEAFPSALSLPTQCAGGASKQASLSVARPGKSGGFQALGIGYSLLKCVLHQGYKVPTPIQRKTIPLILEGKDVVAMARTGSGKTAAFLIPLIEKLKAHNPSGGYRAVVLSPTRELAIQTLKFSKDLSKGSGLKFCLVVGGDSIEAQFSALHENPDVIIATPGRFLHILMEMNIELKQAEYIVFDEADRLFEMGFAEQLREIIHKLPELRQTVLFSATLPQSVVEFAQAGLSDPILVRLDTDTKLPETLRLCHFYTRSDDKTSGLLYLLEHVVNKEQQTIIFVATKHHVEYVRELTQKLGYSVSYIYGSLDQTARKINLAKFRNGSTKLLIVTDVAARGLDIPLLDNVINYDFPGKPKIFVHRAGRVARAGRSGMAYSLLSPSELPYLLDLYLFLGRHLIFASPQISDPDADSVIGVFPDLKLAESLEKLNELISQNSDLQTLVKVTTNAYKMYSKTRPLSSGASVRRAKEIISSIVISVHPTLVEDLSTEEKNRASFLAGVRNYRSKQTIFEVSKSGSASSAINAIKNKRLLHDEVVEKSRSSNSLATELSSSLLGSPSLGESNVSDAQLDQCFKKPPKNSSGSKNNSSKDDGFYLSYTPQTPCEDEKEYAVNSQTFLEQAKYVSFDLVGDENETMRNSATKRKWDRRKKKYVSEGGNEKGKKKIKTESGAYVPASYKTNLYGEWKEKNRFSSDHFKNNHTSSNETIISKHLGGKAAFHKASTKNRSEKNSHVKNELKTPEQIVKQRKLKQKRIEKNGRHGKTGGKTTNHPNSKRSKTGGSSKSNRSSAGKRPGRAVGKKRK